MEASGTSNMKFAMNGGLIIGTMDGANIEIAAEIDRENMFIFGAEAHEVPALRATRRTKAAQPYCPELTRVMDDMAAGKYGPMDEVAPLLNTLKWENDYYLVSHDFPAYLKAQEAVDATYRDAGEWTRRSILSTAGMGKFSTDRTIEEYARDIWHITPCRRLAPVTDAMGRARSFPSLVSPALMGADGGSGSSGKLAAAGGAGVMGASPASSSGAAANGDSHAYSNRHRH
jgi:starch phosphorylase